MDFLIFKKFKAEELIFLSIVFSTLFVKNESYVPILISSWLMAIYYLIFGWYMIPVGQERYLFFSIFSGIIYSVCFISIGICATKNWDGHLFYSLQLIVLTPMSLFLYFKSNWYTYKVLHYLRILFIILINTFCLAI